MKFHQIKIAWAAAAVTLGAWIICSIAVAVFPGGTMGSMAGHLFHLEPQAHNWDLSWGGFAMGAICWTGFAFISAWAFAAVYNALNLTRSEA